MSQWPSTTMFKRELEMKPLNPDAEVLVRMPGTLMIRLTLPAEKLGIHRNELVRRLIAAILDGNRDELVRLLH